MRGLSLHYRQSERGAVLILMAVISVVMVGMAALVVDVGSIMEEKRQLQNGADAGAMAVAQSCALGPCDPDLATDLANGNARDDAMTVKSVTITGNQVVVATETLSSSGTDILPFSFGRTASGDRGDTFESQATARWAPLNAGPALPLVVSACDVAKFRQVTTDSVFEFAKNAGCEGSTDTPGAFGWLDTACPTTASKTPTVTVGTAPADPGKSGPKGCLDNWLNKDVLVPVYGDVIEQGKTYTIVGFAAIHLTGWRFPGDTSPSPPSCGSSGSCISGRFINYVTTGPDGTGTGFGVSVIKLVS